MDKILLSKYFKHENIIAKEDQLEVKPSPKGLVKLKDKLGIKDWEMIYVGDGHDDYLSAKGANVFSCLIAQGLVKDLATVGEMKKDSDFGGNFLKVGKSKLPKFIVAFTYEELLWWFKEVPAFRNQIKAVCFDLGDTLILGGREEAYSLTDKNWPTWDVDSLLEDKKVKKKLKEAILNIQIGDGWRKLGSLPAMNSSEVRIASFFLLELFSLKQKDLVSVLYSEADNDIRDKAQKLSKKMDISLNVKTLPKNITIKELASIYLPEQFSMFIAAGLVQLLAKEKKKPSLDELSIVLLSSFIWISQYRKHEVESYRKHCMVPNGLREFLNFVTKKKKKLCIYTSKTRDIVETALAFEKAISTK